MLLRCRDTGAVEVPLVLGTGSAEEVGLVKGVGTEERAGPVEGVCLVEGTVLGAGLVMEGVKPAAPRALGRSRDKMDVVVTVAIAL